MHRSDRGKAIRGRSGWEQYMIAEKQTAQASNESIWTLTFHGLGVPTRDLPPGEENYWVEPKMFAGVLELVKKRENTQITFDDSYESDYTIALPLLRERNLKARFFVVADRIGQKG